MKEFEQSGLAVYCLADKGTYDKVITEIFDGYDKPIHIDLYNAYAGNLLKGINGVLDSSEYGSKYYDLQRRLESNISRFAAYKAYNATQQIRRQLADKDGVVRSKAEYEKYAKSVVNAFNRYQAAEYNTAISRCRTAKQWVGFNGEANRELFPNLRWLPSRSAEQRPEHIPYYNRVWPKNDPFWQQNQPGNLWNCKCDWEETADDIDNEGVKVTPPPASLAGNPAETGEIFTDKAAYFKASPDRVEGLFVKCERERLQSIFGEEHGHETHGNLSSGTLHNARKPFVRLLNHCRTADQLSAARVLPYRIDELHGVKHEKLGEHKDMTVAKNIKNIAKKKGRGIVSVNKYKWSADGHDWEVVIEVHKAGFEQLYALNPL